MQVAKYQRQMLLPEFGEAKQQKLAEAKVLVIGAGGLGCPVLLYLAAMGVGHIGVIDFDKVEMSNLHRQVLFGEGDIGQPKAVVAVLKLRLLHPNLHIEAFEAMLNTQNALGLIDQYDVVVDGSDNFATRYLVNDACVLLNKPLIYGAVYRFEGQVAVFNVADAKGIKTSYRDLFPVPPAAGEVPNCAEAGVMGVLPGIVGTLMANEAMKVIAGLGQAMLNKLLTYHSLYNSFYEIEIAPNPLAAVHLPKTASEFVALDYRIACDVLPIPEISWQALEELMENTPNDTLLLDVREEDEMPKMEKYPYLAVPLSQFSQKIKEQDIRHTAVLYCQSGVRSKKAAALLQEAYPHIAIFSLEGGIRPFDSINL